MTDIEYDRGDIEFWTPEIAAEYAADLETGEPLIEVCSYCSTLFEVETDCRGLCYEGPEGLEDDLLDEEAAEFERERVLAQTEADEMLRWKWTY